MFKSVLFYTNKLKLLKRFYVNVMGLEMVESNTKQFTIKIGESNIIFRESDQPAFYHFAINPEFDTCKKRNTLQTLIYQCL